MTWANRTAEQNTPITDQTAKIATLDSGGMLATVDSVAYHAAVTRRAVNHYERWFGLATAPNAEIHVADRIGTTVAPFTIDGGNNTWGSWVQVLGSSDTPVAGEATYVKYNLHKILVTGFAYFTRYFVQFGFGASGAAALAAGTYSELIFNPLEGLSHELQNYIQARRQAAGTKAWARCWCYGYESGTMDFFASIIQYEG